MHFIDVIVTANEFFKENENVKKLIFRLLISWKDYKDMLLLTKKRSGL